MVMWPFVKLLWTTGIISGGDGVQTTTFWSGDGPHFLSTLWAWSPHFSGQSYATDLDICSSFLTNKPTHLWDCELISVVSNFISWSSFISHLLLADTWSTYCLSFLMTIICRWKYTVLTFCEMWNPWIVDIFAFLLLLLFYLYLRKHGYGDGGGLFSLIQICQLSSARACGLCDFALSTFSSS